MAVNMLASLESRIWRKTLSPDGYLALQHVAFLSKSLITKSIYRHKFFSSPTSPIHHNVLSPVNATENEHCISSFPAQLDNGSRVRDVTSATAAVPRVCGSFLLQLLIRIDPDPPPTAVC